MSTPIKISQVAMYFKLAPIFVLMIGGKNGSPVIIDGDKVTMKDERYAGQDVALFFSSSENAEEYSAHYPTTREAQVHQTTILEMESIFQGKVDYFAVDLPSDMWIKQEV